MFQVQQISIEQDPFIAPTEPLPHWWQEGGFWPACWLKLPKPAGIFLFRRVFSLDAETKIRIHVSAMERYQLRVDHLRCGFGPARSPFTAYAFETYELTIPAGKHAFSARVWALGDVAPWAQFRAEPGFLLAVETPFGDLSTGQPGWEVRCETGIMPDLSATETIATGIRMHYNLSQILQDWAADEDWSPAEIGTAAQSVAGLTHGGKRYLAPAVLPPQKYEKIEFGFRPVTLAPREKKRVFYDLGYKCFYPQLRCSGSGVIRLGGIEAFVDGENQLLNRKQISDRPREFHYDCYFPAADSRTVGMRPASPMVRRKRDFFEWEFTKKMNAVGRR